MKRVKGAMLACLLALSSMFTGCDESSNSTPEAIAEKYMAASFKQDYETMRNLSTENKKVIDLIEAMMNTFAKDASSLAFINEIKSYTPKAKEPAKIDGNHARVKISYQGRENQDSKEAKEIIKTIDLIKEKDVWKVIPFLK